MNSPTRSRRKWVLWAAAAVMAAAAALEGAARLSGATDFPLYRADAQIGYILAPSQEGSFLNVNHWRFNALSMGAGDFAPSPTATDVLLIGDSVVLGGNPYREGDRLGPQLAAASGMTIWPISAGSWSLRNELTYLRQHPEVVRDVDMLAFVVNNGDFGQASSWSCDLTHPTHRPRLAAVYLFRKYVRGDCDPLRAEMKVPDGDWKQEIQAITALRKPVVFFLYPDREEAADGDLLARRLEPFGRELKAAGIQRVVSVGRDPRWRRDFYRDSIHPTVEGTNSLAKIIAAGIQK